MTRNSNVFIFRDSGGQHLFKILWCSSICLCWFFWLLAIFGNADCAILFSIFGKSCFSYFCSLLTFFALEYFWKVGLLFCLSACLLCLFKGLNLSLRVDSFMKKTLSVVVINHEVSFEAFSRLCYCICLEISTKPLICFFSSLLTKFPWA